MPQIQKELQQNIKNSYLKVVGLLYISVLFYIYIFFYNEHVLILEYKMFFLEAM